MMNAHHHAYIYEGPLAHFAALAADARERFGFVGAAGPDVQELEVEKFGIDEARELVRTTSLTSVSGRALYIVGVSSITTDAQQALLKLFEEPQEGVIFVLLVPYGTIIATLRSRLLQYPIHLPEDGPPESGGPSSGRTFAQTAVSFLQKNNKARSDDIAALLKDEEMLKERVRDFLDGLEASLHEALTKTKGKKELCEALEDIAKVRGYANDRSPSMKMLLEHLAISLPRL